MNKGIFKLSKHNTEKLDLVNYSIDKAIKNAQTPNDVMNSLFKWAYHYGSIYALAHVSLAMAIRSHDISLKNGTGVKNINSEYRAMRANKVALHVILDNKNFGDLATVNSNIKRVLLHSRWYFKQNALTAFGHYATPIDMDTAKDVAKDLKQNLDNFIDESDPHTALKKAESKATSSLRS